MQSILLAAGLTAGTAQATLPKYRIFGLESKPAIVIIHGFPGNATDWYHMAERLSQRYRVIVPDLLGFNHSQTNNASFHELWVESQADRITALVDSLKIKSYYVIGHDLGTSIGVMVAARHPERVKALMIGSGNVLADPKLNGMMRSAFWPVIGAVSRNVILSC
ncbi:MAG: alpha/beta fold hydrolase [Cyclobacteriaceae bacterium]|nr:alpha/beta fold hydrolase [Cyclobacteriaceae bacterium]UYN87260.1 MAG: alpha/beta fold hydrolase [Cyclobacteriaceae bacterium]